MEPWSDMDELDITNPEAILDRMRAQADAGALRITQHAQQEMVEEDITVNEVLRAIATAQVLENYPEHRGGPCCLLCGLGRPGYHVHIVCTTARQALIIVTVYEPKPPKWITPTQRGPK